MKVRTLTRRLFASLFVLIAALAITPTAAQAAETTIIYRLYNSSTGEHHYTHDANEYATLGRIGWVQEGCAWIAPTQSQSPVYRLYNPNSGDHHYTMDANERDTLVRIGWTYENVGWYSDEAKTVKVYRLFNPNEVIGTHHYTTSLNEYNTLGNIGWRKEDVAWYAVQLPPTTPSNGSQSQGGSGASVPSQPSAPQESVVYWTPGGTKWHSTKDCPALGRSHTILSGTVQQAQATGKDAPCKDCH